MGIRPRQSLTRDEIASGRRSADRRRLIALAVVVAVLALAAWGEWTLEVVPFTRHRVPTPALSASPREVVRAYVEALDAHDCATAKELWLRGDRSTPELWCSHASRAEIVGGMHSFHESPRRIDVSLTLHIRWRPLEDDGTVPGDPFPWTYVLTRDAQRAWRIADNGQG